MMEIRVFVFRRIASIGLRKSGGMGNPEIER